jgi:hypothetical protein
MKAKFKLLSLVLSIAFSGILFTQCVKNEESDGVRTVREGYAEKLKGDADYLKALAEKERAEAEKIRITAQWEKDEAAARVEWTNAQTELEKVKVELEKVKVEHEKNLNDLEIAEKEATLEKTKAVLETQIAQAKTNLLAAQQAHALALITNETALITAKNALAAAQAKALANDPNLVEYQALYTKLFSFPNYYGKRTDLLSDKLGLQTQILGLQYATNEEQLAWLKRDSVKAAEELKYTKELLGKYESLYGLSVAELQTRVDQAELDWTEALAIGDQKYEALTDSSSVYNEEYDKWYNERNKLNDLINKLTYSGSTLLILDSLYYLNSYSSPPVYPASISELVNQVQTSYMYGYKDILNRATGRLAYLKSEDINSYQPTGFTYSSTPSDYEPTKKYLEEKIRYIEDVQVQAIDIQITEQTAKVADANTKLTAGNTAWEGAKSAYEASVTQVNNAVAVLRGHLVTWEKAAKDSVNSPTAGAASLTQTNQNIYFSAIKNYYVARYNFDRKEATYPASQYVPAYEALIAASFTSGTFFAQNNLAFDWQAQANLAGALLAESNVKIVNNYEYDVIDNNGSSGTINDAWYSATSPDPDATAYVNSRLGALLYQSRNVYGASSLIDVHYFLPYDTRKPESTVNGKIPSFESYGVSLFGVWKTADNELTTMKTAKANTFYIENYKTVLALVNRTIAFYEDLAVEYGALVAETEAAVAAQQIVVNEQAKVREAAYAAMQEANAAYNTAYAHANNLYNLYDLLSNSTTGTLEIIKAQITALEGKINHPETGLIKQVEEKNAAIRKYIAEGYSGKVIADEIAIYEVQVKDTDAKIAALEVIINDIEAKMQALLQQPSLE